MIRVQIPAYHDAWMQGDRYGIVMKTSIKKYKAVSGHRYEHELAYVKLDKSNKVVRVILDDCTVLP